MEGRLQSALAGAAAAIVWSALEPLDVKLFRHDYSDTAMLGKLVTRSRAWPLAGLVLHAGNGVVFGLAYHQARRLTKLPPRRLGVAMALVENTALYTLAPLVDRFHPARGERGVAAMWSRRAFAQETFRHVVFGVTLGTLARSSAPASAASTRTS